MTTRQSPGITEDEGRRLQCENAYLKDRCAQLEASVADLEAKLDRLRAGTKLPRGSRTGWHASLLSSGQ
jgi:predicted nuclease with TOPRIM domain